MTKKNDVIEQGDTLTKNRRKKGLYLKRRAMTDSSIVDK
jgi:hypothetical protein